jgi:hypothetical protein
MTKREIEKLLVQAGGKDWDEAYENAIDALAAWLAHAQASFIKTPSTHKALEKLKAELVPVPVDEKIIESYEDLKRINIILPVNTLEKIDGYRKKVGLKRSTFLVHAAEEYLERHGSKNLDVTL